LESCNEEFPSDICQLLVSGGYSAWLAQRRPEIRPSPGPFPDSLRTCNIYCTLDPLKYRTKQEGKTLKTLRFFNSSPGDVFEERAIANRVIERLQSEYIGKEFGGAASELDDPDLIGLDPAS
jgi:hypothetical protein